MHKAKCPPSLTDGTEEVGITWGEVTNTRVANKGESHQVRVLHAT